jgi:hypothetical protein
MTPAEVTAQVEALTPELLAERTAVLHLSNSRPMFKRPLKKGSKKVVLADNGAVDPETLTISKDLLDREVLAKIDSAQRRIRQRLLGLSSPCAMMADAMYVINLQYVEAADAAVEAYIVERAGLVEELRDGYDAAKAKAKRRLGVLYNEADYPEPEALAEAFAVRSQWLTLNVPNALKRVNEAIYDREQARVRRDVAAAGERIVGALAQEVSGLVEHLMTVLEEDKDGKPKVFRNTSVTKLQKALAMLSVRDVTGNPDLAAAAAMANDLLSDVKPGSLRTEAMAREMVRDGLATVKARLSEMVTTAPARRLRDDDAAV